MDTASSRLVWRVTIWIPSSAQLMHVCPACGTGSVHFWKGSIDSVYAGFTTTYVPVETMSFFREGLDSFNRTKLNCILLLLPKTPTKWSPQLTDIMMLYQLLLHTI